MVLEHLVGKLDEFLRGAVDLAHESAFNDTGAGDHIGMRHQRNVVLRDTGLHRAYFRSDLLHRAVDDGVDVRLKKALERVAPTEFSAQRQTALFSSM